MDENGLEFRSQIGDWADIGTVLVADSQTEFIETLVASKLGSIVMGLIIN